MSEEPRRDWVSQRAIAWVLDEAPCPTELLPVLTAIARRCDENGKGSFQSKETIAEKTGKSEAQVTRDVRLLLAGNLIKLGDQTLPERLGFKRGQGPKVYDVNLGLKGPKPSKASKNKSGKKRPDLGRGGMEATQTIPMNNPVKNPSNNPSLSAREDDAAGSIVVDAKPERDRAQVENQTETIESILAAHRLTDTDAAAFRADADTKGGPKGLGWYLALHRNGDLARLITQWRTNPQPHTTTGPGGSRYGIHIHDDDPRDPGWCSWCGNTPESPDHRPAHPDDCLHCSATGKDPADTTSIGLPCPHCHGSRRQRGTRSLLPPGTVPISYRNPQTRRSPGAQRFEEGMALADQLDKMYPPGTTFDPTTYHRTGDAA